MILVKSELSSSPCIKFSSHSFEDVAFCEIRNSNLTTLVSCIYRSPSSSADNDARLCSLLELIGDESKNYCLVCVGGDFNFPTIDWVNMSWPASNDAFMDSVLSACLTQHVENCTRGSNILDLVFSNDFNAVSDVEVLAPLKNSDHFCVSFSLVKSCPSASSTDRPHKIFYDWARAPWSRIAFFLIRLIGRRS